MAVVALTDAFVHVGSHDFTTDINQVTAEADVTELNATTFGTSWTTLKGGVKNLSFNMSGFWQAGPDTVDEVAFADLGTVDRVFSFGHINTETSPAYICQAMNVKYSLGGSHGELTPFTLAAGASNTAGVVRGQLAVKKVIISATGAAGTGLQLGAVGATQYLYATLHVFDIDGATFTAVVESDDNGSFTTPTTRATFSGIAANGGTWATRVAGAITDDYFRINVTSLAVGTPVVAAVIAVGS